MYKHEGYMAGANLGHWISQYSNASDEHFNTYITEPDIARMASWGMDHVRLPVDYFIFEDDANPGVYKEKGLSHIDDCLSWCKKHGMNMLLDLHHAPGYFFGDGDKNTLFSDRNMQLRYINIWKFFAARYAAEGYNLAFDLLNELVLPEGSAKWNALWQEVAAEIHKISPRRNIVVGGNYWNSINEVRNLTLVDDDRIWYNFHCYCPMIFTHQRAGWMENTRRYTTPVEWPCDTSLHADFYGGADKIPEAERGLLDKEYLRRALAPVFDFVEKNKRPLYCGEYGVIANASTQSAINWQNDMADLLLEHGIGRAVWSYRGFSGITDAQNNVVSEELVRAVSRH